MRVNIVGQEGQGELREVVEYVGDQGQGELHEGVNIARFDKGVEDENLVEVGEQGQGELHEGSQVLLGVRLPVTRL